MNNSTKIVLLVLGTIALAWILARAGRRKWYHNGKKIVWQGNTPVTAGTANSEAGLGGTTSAGTGTNGTTGTVLGSASAGASAGTTSTGNIAIVNADGTKTNASN